MGYFIQLCCREFVVIGLTRKTQPPLSLQSNMAGVREREDANRTREARDLDEIQAGAGFAGLSTIISQPSTFVVQRSAVGRSAWLDILVRLFIGA
jgi:hypothetical protein